MDKKYWQTHYSDLSDIDGVVNAKEHADYLKAFFELECLEVNSIADFGFGHGALFKEMVKAFRPKTAFGIEPSEYIFKKFKSKKIHVENLSLLEWCKKNKKTKLVYDLGICTSVFQYIPDHDLKIIIPILSQKVRYFYFSVPTDLEYKNQWKEHEFKDEYAIVRSQKMYLNLLRPHFTFISNRLLESKYHFNSDTTHFQEMLFRF